MVNAQHRWTLTKATNYHVDDLIYPFTFVVPRPLKFLVISVDTAAILKSVEKTLLARAVASESDNKSAFQIPANFC